MHHKNKKPLSHFSIPLHWIHQIRVDFPIARYPYIDPVIPDNTAGPFTLNIVNRFVEPFLRVELHRVANDVGILVVCFDNFPLIVFILSPNIFVKCIAPCFGPWIGARITIIIIRVGDVIGRVWSRLGSFTYRIHTTMTNLSQAGLEPQ